MRRRPLVVAMEALLIAWSASVAGGASAQVNAVCTVSGDGQTATCTDVSAQGVRYTSGIARIDLGNNGASGPVSLNAATVGIQLARSAGGGGSIGDVDFKTVAWDTDGNSSTEKVTVVTFDGTTPYLIGSDYILVSSAEPEVYTVGTQTYSAATLMQQLASAPGLGSAVVGGLMVNNNAGPRSRGVDLSTRDASGIVVSSLGGTGGSGACYSVLFIVSWCNDGAGGGNASSVVVNHDAVLTVNLSDGVQEMPGISAVSQGGTGGSGGGFVGFVSMAGAGGHGGDGGTVTVWLGANSDITTNGSKSHGVLADSRGGNGGTGGSHDGVFALGDKGGTAGDAGAVTVIQNGAVLTQGWNSHGILARSVGGGAGSGSRSGGLYAEGGNGGHASDGAAVTVANTGSITTQSQDSFGILAQSIGGGGGDGGGAGGWFSVGGRGGSGGDAGEVRVSNDGTVKTLQDRATALFAQSIGGGGGNGGDAVAIGSAVSVAVGGNGGEGGDGHKVTVELLAHGVISTGSVDEHEVVHGAEAAGILAQSIGGGGGNGGLAVSGTVPGVTAFNIGVTVGGRGGAGGDAGELVRVTTEPGSTIDTTGVRSPGIAAQSIGGGGGNGGVAFSGAGGPGLSLTASVGGTGAPGGDGKTVEVVNKGSIETQAAQSAGIFTQSIGGSGGNGGFAGTLGLGAASVSVSVGGSGAVGGTAGKVDVDNLGGILTHGDSAAGIFAQSIGGGGGNGGSALSSSVGLASASITVAGNGGAGNTGGLVDITNEGTITTQGQHAAGIFAQSIGGGGGNGGDVIGLAVGALGVNVGVGGSGDEGGDSTGVNVTNNATGKIITAQSNSDGIFAQSVAGGGGSGGSATTTTIVFPVKVGEVEIPAMSAAVTVAGSGGGGGTAGAVAVSNGGDVTTSGFLSNGVFAQSVGGGGGKGGNATNVTLQYDASFTGQVAVGGTGGKGGTGGTVTVSNGGNLTTHGSFANGVFAQSVGGGGGVGGNATNITMSLSPPPTSVDDLIPSPSASFQVAIGGNGGTGATGGDVTVNPSEPANPNSNLLALPSSRIETDGLFSAGIMAQSVGGAGGFGGDARTINISLTADPLDFIDVSSLAQANLTLTVGGQGGTGSHGGKVVVNQHGEVITHGAFSHGIVAQSVGGGGGSGGSAMVFDFSTANVVPEIPVLNDILSATSPQITLQGSGGGGGNGGQVTLNSAGSVSTSGAFAMGLVAQSVAGGGGLAGVYNPRGVSTNSMIGKVFNSMIQTDQGITFAGSAGGAGNAGDVTVTHTGAISTTGDGAHGVFAQSVAGQGTAGAVTVTFDGTIQALGRDAYGVYAQSGGGSGHRNITVTLQQDSQVQGGSGTGAAVMLVGGATNMLTNRGALSALSGNAILAGSGNDTLQNHGTVTGSVQLGAGANAFVNNTGARFDTGSTVALGAGNALTNHGELAPAGRGVLGTTVLTGALVQASDGVLAMDVSLAGTASDAVTVSGAAQLDGVLWLNALGSDHPQPGRHQHVLVSAAGGVSASGLQLATASSAVVSHTLTSTADQALVIDTTVDFAPPAAGPNAQQIGQHLNAVLAAGVSTSFAPVVEALVAQPDAAHLATAYRALSPNGVGQASGAAVAASLQFNDALHSCRQREGEHRFSREGECNWLKVGFASLEQQQTAQSDGYRVNTSRLAGGLQRRVGADLYAGVGLSYERSGLDAINARVNGDRVEAGVIIKRVVDDTRLSASLTGAYGRYDSLRNVSALLAAQSARAKYSQWALSAHGRASHDFVRDDNAYIRPMLTVGLQQQVRGGYSEDGAGPLNLTVSRTTSTAVTLQPAIEVGNERVLTNGILLRPFFRLGATHYVTGRDQHVTAGLSAAPAGTGTFTVTSQNGRNFTDVALGVDLLTRAGGTLRLDHEGQYASDSSANTTSLKWSMPF